MDNKLFLRKSGDFPGGSDGKASVYNVGDPGSVLGLGRSPGEGNGNPLQYSCLENPMDCSLPGCKESDTTERLHFHFEHSLALPFFGIGMKTDLFQSCGHC